jgi:DNA-binding response OmpR family regulator
MPKCAAAVSCDQNVLAFRQAALSGADYEAISASEPEVVVQTLLGTQPELILLDLGLSRRVAANVLHWIGTREPRPGLVLVSSGENLEVLREGFVAPDFQLLIKPFREDEIKTAVDVAARHQGNPEGPGFPEGRLSK